MHELANVGPRQPQNKISRTIKWLTLKFVQDGKRRDRYFEKHPDHIFYQSQNKSPR